LGIVPHLQGKVNVFPGKRVEAAAYRKNAKSNKKTKENRHAMRTGFFCWLPRTSLLVSGLEPVTPCINTFVLAPLAQMDKFPLRLKVAFFERVRFARKNGKRCRQSLALLGAACRARVSPV
jgi:hypothetical protein